MTLLRTLTVAACAAAMGSSALGAGNFLVLPSHPPRGVAADGPAPPAPGGLSPAAAQAVGASLADGVSTLGALAAGAVETNPLVPSSPLGIVLLTAGKMGLAQWADGLPEAERAETLSSMSAVFGGAAANNLLVMAAAAPQVALVAGLVTGLYLWQDSQRKLQAEADAQRQRYLAQAAEHQRVTLLAYHAARAPAPLATTARPVTEVALLATPLRPLAWAAP